jgi:hypothetical protein
MLYLFTSERASAQATNRLIMKRLPLLTSREARNKTQDSTLKV